MASGGAAATLQLMVLTFVTLNSQSKKIIIIIFLQYPTVSSSDHPLTKKLEDTGYKTAASQARKRGGKGEKPFLSRLGIITHFSYPLGACHASYFIISRVYEVVEVYLSAPRIFSQPALQCISVYFWNDQQFNILSLEKIPDLLDYERSLFPLRDSQRKRTSEQARNRLFTLAARHASHVKKRQAISHLLGCSFTWISTDAYILRTEGRTSI